MSIVRAYSAVESFVQPCTATTELITARLYFDGTRILQNINKIRHFLPCIYVVRISRQFIDLRRYVISHIAPGAFLAAVVWGGHIFIGGEGARISDDIMHD